MAYSFIDGNKSSCEWGSTWCCCCCWEEVIEFFTLAADASQLLRPCSTCRPAAQEHTTPRLLPASRSCKNIIKSFWASSWTLPLFSDSTAAPATITRPLNLINNVERYPWLWWAHNLDRDICNGGRNLLRERLPSGHPFLHACCATSWKRIYDFKRNIFSGVIG